MTDRHDDERRIGERFDAYLRHEIGQADVRAIAGRATEPAPRRPGARWAIGGIGATVVLALAFTLSVTQLLPATTSPTPSASAVPTPSASASAGARAAERIGTFAGGGLWAQSGSALYLSTDGGATWSAGSIDPDPVAVFVLDAQHAWTVTIGPGSTGNTGDPQHDVLHYVVNRTSDGGASWQSTAIDGSYPETGAALSFVDAEHGYLLIEPERFSATAASVFATGDDGSTWQHVATAGANQLWYARMFAAAPDGTLWSGAEVTAAGAGEWDLLSVSRDGGATWSAVPLPGRERLANGDFLLAPPAIFGSTVVIAVDAYGPITFYRSADAGRTWDVSQPLPFDGEAGTPEVLDPKHWVVAPPTGLDLWITDDAGQTWHEQSTQGLPGNGPIAGVAFARDGEHGMALVSLGNTPTPSGLFVTTDGGRTWQPAALPGASASPAPQPSGGSGPWTGLTWSDPGTVTAPFIYALVEWHGEYVGVGQGSGDNGTEDPVAISQDGIHWRTVHTGSTFGDYPIHIAALPNALVAVGNLQLPAGCPQGEGAVCTPAASAPVWFSTDATHWTQVAPDSFGQAYFAALAAGPKGAVITGQTVTGQPALWFSPDGSHWRAVQLGSVFDKAMLNSVTATADGFFVAGGIGEPDFTSGGAGGYGTRVPAGWWSSDGLTWHAAPVVGATAAPGAQLLAIYAGSGGLLAIGSDNPTSPRSGSAWASADGRSWSSVEIPMPYSALLMADGTHVVAIGPDPAGDADSLAAWLSTDGAQWQRLGISGNASTMPGGDPSLTSKARLDTVRVVSGGLVAIGSLGADQLSWFADAGVPHVPVASSSGAPLGGPSVSATDSNAGFTLTMTLDHDRYRAGQPITVTTTLAYGGPDPTVKLWTNSDPGLVDFDVTQVGGPLSMLGGGTTDCVSTSMAKGQAISAPFAKVGGWSNDDPYAAFYESYYNDPQLRLPAGTWQISAKSGFGIGGTDCGSGQDGNLRTTIKVVVEP